MADQAQPTFRYTPADPELKDVLDLWKKDVMLSTNCHAIATVKSFNPADTNFTPNRPTITAQINYCRTLFLPDSSGTPQPTYKNYPLLVNVPVIILSGGGSSSLTFPIEEGLQCLIFFNDRSLDNWALGAESGPLSSPRLHHLSDGLALVGFPVIQNYSSTHAILANGTTQVGVSSSKVLINNSANHSLGAILTDLASALSTFMTATSAAITVAQVAAAASAASSAVSTANSQLAALLE